MEQAHRRATQLELSISALINDLRSCEGHRSVVHSINSEIKEKMEALRASVNVSIWMVRIVGLLGTITY